METNNELLKELLDTINQKIQSNHVLIRNLNKIIQEVKEENNKLIPKSNDLYKQIYKSEPGPVVSHPTINFSATTPPVTQTNMFIVDPNPLCNQVYMADTAINSGAYMSNYSDYERKVYYTDVYGMSEKTIKDYIKQFKKDKYKSLKSTIMNDKI